MMRNKLLVLTCFLFWLYASCLATASNFDTQNLRFKHISIDQGLSQSVVTFVAQDHTGLMWIATQDGLNVFDGNKISIFKHSYLNENSLSDNNINHILVDSRNRVFIATDAGLDLYDPSINGFHRLNLQTSSLEKHTSRVHISSLAEDELGNIWVLGHHGVYVYTLEEKYLPAWNYLTTENKGLLKDYYYSIFTENGQIWIGGDAKLLAINGLGHINDWSKQLSDPIEVNKIMRHQGDLLIASDSGVYKLTDNYFRPYLPELLSGYYVQDMVSQQDTLWIGTESGLLAVDRQTKVLTKHRYSINNRIGLSSSDIMSVFVDKMGMLWVGTYGGGINLWDPNTAQFGYQLSAQVVSEDFPENNVWGIWTDVSNQIWIGASRSVLAQVDPVDGSMQYFRVTDALTTNDLESDIMAIAGDVSGRIWVGTNRAGLFWFDPSTQRFVSVNRLYPDLKSFSQDIIAIYQDRNGDMYVGTNIGLVKFSINADNITAVDISTEYSGFVDGKDKRVGAIYHDSKDNLWIGTGSGLVVRHQGRYLYLDSGKGKHQLTHQEVYSITEDKYGNIWVGTADGLNQLQIEGGALKVIERFNEEVGLNNDTIYSVLTDDSANLWLATNFGLIKYNPMLRQLQHYRKEHGLQSNEFNQSSSHLDSQGYMYFGGINGLNRFHPDKLSFNHFPPRVLISSITSKEREVGFASNHEEGFVFQGTEDEPVEFRLGTDDFARDHVKLRYRVNEGRWRELNINSFTLNLEPGNHQIQFQAGDRFDGWDAPVKTVKLKIKGRFWTLERTIIFGLLLVILVLLGAILFQRLKQQQQGLQHQNELSFIRRQYNIISNLANSFQKEIAALDEETLRTRSQLQSLQRQWHQQRFIDNVTELRNFYPNNLELIEHIQTRLSNYNTGVGILLFGFDASSYQQPLQAIQLNYLSRQLSDYLKNYFDSDVVIMRLQENSFCLVMDAESFVDFDQQVDYLFNQLRQISFEGNNQNIIELDLFSASAFIPAQNSISQPQLQSLFVNLENHLDFGDGRQFKLEILANIPPELVRFIDKDLQRMVDNGLVNIR